MWPKSGKITLLQMWLVDYRQSFSNHECLSNAYHLEKE